jgi:hypothetical protein
MKALLSLDTYDHPLVFVFFLALALVPVLVAISYLARRAGVPVPSLALSQ